MLSTGHNQLSSHYDRIWNESKDSILANNIVYDPPPEDTSPRWGISIVIKPSKVVSARISDVLPGLHKYLGDDQSYYDNANFHTTITTIEFYRSKFNKNDERVLQYKEILQTLINKFKTVRINYEGIVASKSGVLVQGFPIDNTLQEIRGMFREALEENSLLNGPETEHPRQTAHSSLAVFLSPILDPEGLVQFIDENRHLKFGLSEADSIDLVGYHRTKKRTHMEVLWTLRF